MNPEAAPGQPANANPPDQPEAANVLLRRFEVRMPKEQLTKELDELAARTSREAKLPGFRQGKVPVEVVKKVYKKALEEEIVSQTLGRLASQHIRSQNLQIIGQPLAEKVDYQEGQDLRADIVVEVFPDFEFPALSTLEVPVPKAELAEASEAYDEAKQIERVLEGNKKRVPVKEREIREKDLIHFRVQSRTLDSKKMSPGRDMYALMDRTAGSEILGLVEELLGKHPGEHLTLKRTYPSEHPKKAWAGREVEHRIEIKAVFEFVKPALDGEFLQSLGIQNEEEFRRKLKDDYEHQQEHRREDLILEHIFKTFQQLAQFPLPQTLIRQELSRRLAQNRTPLHFRDEEEKKKFQQTLLESAQKSVQLSLILDKIRRSEGIDVTADDLQKEYQQLAAQYGLPEREVKRYYEEDEARLEPFKDQLLDAKVIAFVKEKVKVKEV